MKLFDNILGTVDKIVPAAFKDHDKKLSSKRIFKLGGGGYLIYEGIEFLNTAIETDNKTALFAGIGCLVVGGLLAIGLSEKIKQVQIKDQEKK